MTKKNKGKNDNSERVKHAANKKAKYIILIKNNYAV
jgi:hypothetical protein